ncbi:MAG: prepilin-type N-terminal cleavage/methylation domain-containing protein [Candidatus Omnitrophica bacterium]|jgi:prepilin-type N-terminal cleavage/methylation domain-containing protein|nr:prepilin-type N-terminal cleavage/methylation domain-containing protein [Candidatus Omnitrophota bacterium]
MKKGFTLIELLVVIVIIGILVSLSVPMYRKAVLRGHDREAKAMLRLIQAAEKVYRLEVGYYVNCNNFSECNDRLDLDLSGTSWNYRVTDNSVTNFCAKASNGGGEYQNWYINSSTEEASQTVCP